MGSRQTSLNDVIHCRMPLVSSLTPPTAEGMPAYRASTAVPQCWQEWGPQTAVPKRRPTATLTVLSSIRRPRAVTGKAISQGPDSLVDTERRRARSSSFSAPSSIRSAAEAARKPSQAFCLQAAALSGVR